MKPLVTGETTLRELGEILERRGGWLERAEIDGVAPVKWRVEYVEEPHYVTARAPTLFEAIRKAMMTTDMRRRKEGAR